MKNSVLYTICRFNCYRFNINADIVFFFALWAYGSFLSGVIRTLPFLTYLTYCLCVLLKKQNVKQINELVDSWCKNVVFIYFFNGLL